MTEGYYDYGHSNLTADDRQMLADIKALLEKPCDGHSNLSADDRQVLADTKALLEKLCDMVADQQTGHARGRKG